METRIETYPAQGSRLLFSGYVSEVVWGADDLRNDNGGVDAPLPNLPL